MKLKQPNLTNVNFKMARGLSADARGVFLSRSNMMLPMLQILQEAQFADLKPGEETDVRVEVTRAQLPVNADVKSIAATLHVMKPDAASLKGMEQSVVGVKDLGPSTNPNPDAPERSYALKMDAPGGPRNVQLRLGDGPAFWTHAGTLDAGSYPLPDFSDQLNQILDGLQPEAASIPLPFRLKSDTPGQVRIEIGQIEFSLLQTQSWTNPLDDTVRVDRNLQIEFGSGDLIPLQPPGEVTERGFSLASLMMDIGGELGPERVLGNVPAHGGREFATLSSQFSLAQSFVLEAPIRLAGLTGVFGAAAEAELYAEVQPDLDGAPAPGEALTRASLTLTAAGQGSRAWAYISFDSAIELDAGKRYWMVLKSIRGEVRLGLKIREAEPYGEILINRGGQMWKRLGWAHKPAALFRMDISVQTLLNDERRFEELRQVFNTNAVVLSPSSSAQPIRGGWQVIDPTSQRLYRIQAGPGSLEVFESTLVGLLRLVYLPELDNQTAAVEIRLEGLTGLQKIDPLPEAQSLSIPVSGWQGQTLVLEILSHARGTLSIANVVQEYRK